MSRIDGGGGHYISDGDLMAWLAQQQDRIYGDLEGEMQGADQRKDFAEALTTIKGDLQVANDTKDFSKVDKELQDFMEKYGSDPQFESICADIKDIADTVHKDWGARVDFKQQKEEQNALKAKADEARAKGRGAPLTDEDKTTLQKESASARQLLVDPGPLHYGDSTMQGWKDKIGGKVDKLNQSDQLTMIHIQQLKATLDQGSQLASQFIASDDKACNSIIHNLA
jgi:hypothetical protein